MLFSKIVTGIGEPEKPTPTINQVFWLLVMIWIIALPVGLGAQRIMMIFPEQQSWILLVGYLLQFGISLLVAMRWWQLSSFAFNKVKLTVYLVLIPATLALSVIAEGLVSLIPMPESIAEMFANMISYDLPGYLLIGIIAPILEELIFRGVVLRGLLNRYNPQKAIIWSAVVFGLAHLNPWQFIAAFIIGLVMGWLYFKTQSILPGIFIHWLNNSVGFALGAYYSDMNTTFYQLSGNMVNYIMLLMACIMICIGGYWALTRILPVNKQEIQ